MGSVGGIGRWDRSVMIYDLSDVHRVELFFFKNRMFPVNCCNVIDFCYAGAVWKRVSD